jgi:hypothetical protein
MAYNQTKIKMWRRCHRQYAFRYDTKPGKELVRTAPSLPLKRGSWLHELQESYHRQLAGVGGSWRERQAELAAEFSNLFEEERAEYGDLPGECERLFRSYLRFARDQGDTERYSVATLRGGGGPAVEFVIEVPLTKFGIEDPFKGRVDILMEDHEYGGLWVWDSKWVRSLPTPDERMMSPQSLMYVWALKQMGYDVRGFVFNYGRTKPPAIPTLLKRGTLSTRQRMDTDYGTYLTTIKEVHGDKWKLYAKRVYIKKLRELKNREGMWFRRERIPVEDDRITRALQEFVVSIRQIEKRSAADKKYPPRSYFYNCRWNCEYHDLCVAEFTGLDIKPLIKRSFTFEEERYGEEDILDSGSSNGS